MTLQIIFNSLITGAIYGLIAVGFSLIYKVHRFFYIAHGGILALGAFTFYTFYQLFNWNLVFSFLAALVSVMFIGSAIELLIHRSLRKRKATALLFFLASTAVFILIQNILLFLFGPSVRTYRFDLQESISIGGAFITPTQIIIFSTSILIFVILYLFIKYTKLGKSIRAVSDDPIAAATVGINVEAVYIQLINLSAILGCIAGVLMSLEKDVRFDMGLHAILMGIVSSIIGGIGNVPASILGGFLLGAIENTSLWLLPAGYKQVVTFGVLILVLLIRPQGLLGTRINRNGL
jgi:branched-chain amino acid transport system permease protein